MVTFWSAEGLLQAYVGGGDHAPRKNGQGRSLSRRGLVLAWASSAKEVTPPEARPFRAWLPAVDQFPWESWTKISARVYRRLSPRMLLHGDAAGYGPLREAVAGFVAASRAVRCAPEQVIVTSGGRAALDLAARFLLDPDDWAWVEEPTHPGVRAAFAAAGARIAPVPVDEEGLDVAAGRRTRPHARLAFVVPSHQYPLGVTMSLRRRLELLEWASGANAWVLEDDWDSEYRYAGRPLAALQGLDAEGRVVYIGSFSLVTFPALRLGYIVVPADLVAPFRAARYQVDHCSPLLQQAVLAEFIAEGHLTRYARRMRLLYAERQEALLRAARRELKGLLEVRRSEAGLHLVGWLPEGVSGEAAARIAEERGVDVTPVPRGTHGTLERDGLVLGYGGFDEAHIEEGVTKLGEALRAMPVHTEATGSR